MLGNHTEAAFEAVIEEHLLSSGGYVKGDRDTFDPERCIDAETFVAFVKETQPKEWEYLANLQKEKAEEVLLDDLCRALDPEHEGCLWSYATGSSVLGSCSERSISPRRAALIRKLNVSMWQTGLRSRASFDTRTVMGTHSM